MNKIKENLICLNKIEIFQIKKNKIPIKKNKAK